MTGLGGVAASDLACGSRRRFPASSAVFLPPFFSLSAFNVLLYLAFVSPLSAFTLSLSAFTSSRPCLAALLLFIRFQLLLVRLRFLFVRLHFVFVCFHLVVVLLGVAWPWLSLPSAAALGLSFSFAGVASGWSNPIPKQDRTTQHTTVITRRMVRFLEKEGIEMETHLPTKREAHRPFAEYGPCLCYPPNGPLVRFPKIHPRREKSNNPMRQKGRLEIGNATSSRAG